MPPIRVLDTRTGSIVPAGGSVDVQLTGGGGVPATGVASVAVNITATEALGAGFVDVTAPGFVTVFPTGSALMEVSNLHGDTAGQIIPSLVTSQLGTGGRVTMFSNAGTHLVADVAGWYTG